MARGRGRRRKHHSAAFRKQLWRRHHRVCALCGQPLSLGQLTIDHVRPLSGGGYDRRKNLVPAHADCNHAKGSLSPGEWQRQQARKEREDAQETG